MPPFFSIVTVTRNNLDGLKRTRESLLMQTSADFEWIVVDGDSSDGTREFLGMTRSLWVSEPDSGIYDAMNKGLAQASGTYVLFLNAGDRLALPDILADISKSIYGQIQRQAPDFIYGDSLESVGEALPVYKTAHPPSKIHLGMFTHHQAMLYRRDKIGGVQYNVQYKIAADYDFTARFLQQNPDVFYMAEPLCIFEGGGLSQQKARAGRKEQYQIRKMLKMVSPFKNAAIFAAQTLVWFLRSLSPTFYWRVRSLIMR